MGTTTLMGDLRSFDKGGLFDFGHPFLNRIAESFVKAAGIGAVQAVSIDAYFTAAEVDMDSSEVLVWMSVLYHPKLGATRGVDSHILKAKNTGKVSMQWGLAAGVYSGLTYGLKEARGTHDWKNGAVAGAITGVALALTIDDTSHKQITESAITGAALSTAAHFLAGIF